ncbi:MAG: hypothetical protein UV60_C0006G0026 [Parcubacteria group bacterium GW2011_GWA2_43_11]|nr:MAG: hypothetical protein UU89_C0005G0021 [Parcubacteria group bacterium GW2011_GWC2_42_11]KKS85674.1 MAG: hypothetical protein UV60_C0006G0026 [Parcubacteria group bacterium GW2011_GWA2_43_11]
MATDTSTVKRKRRAQATIKKHISSLPPEQFNPSQIRLVWKLLTTVLESEHQKTMEACRASISALKTTVCEDEWCDDFDAVPLKEVLKILQ